MYLTTLGDEDLRIHAYIPNGQMIMQARKMKKPRIKPTVSETSVAVGNSSSVVVISVSLCCNDNSLKSCT